MMLLYENFPGIGNGLGCFAEPPDYLKVIDFQLARDYPPPGRCEPPKTAPLRQFSRHHAPMEISKQRRVSSGKAVILCLEELAYRC